jgi:hypothetical protein
MPAHWSRPGGPTRDSPRSRRLAWQAARPNPEPEHHTRELRIWLTDEEKGRLGEASNDVNTSTRVREVQLKAAKRIENSTKIPLHDGFPPLCS